MEKPHGRGVRGRTTFLILVLCVLFVSLSACGADPEVLSTGVGKKHKTHASEGTPKPPEILTDATVDSYVAQLGDEQVRRLLIAELRKQATAPEKTEGDRLSGFAMAVQKAEDLTARIHKRWNVLASGVLATPGRLFQSDAGLPERHGPFDPVRFISVFALLFVTGSASEWLFRRLTAKVKMRLESPGSTSSSDKLKHLGLMALMDFGAIGVFAITTLAVFLPVFGNTSSHRILILAYLGVILLMRSLAILARFVLAPDTPALRWVALNDAAASGCYRWIRSFLAVVGAGLLASVFLELERSSESLVVLTGIVTRLIVAIMAIALMLGNRASITGFLLRSSRDPLAGRFRSRTADLWVFFAIPYVVVLWVLWALDIFLERDAAVLPLLATWGAPLLYLILNGVLQRLLDDLAGTAGSAAEGEATTGSAEAMPSEEASSAGVEGKPPAQVIPHRLVRAIRCCLSVSLGGGLFFWILHLWGFDVSIEERVMEAAFQVAVAVIVTFAAWKAIERAIDARLEKVRRFDSGEDGLEAYGKGGNRVHTILILTRKAALVALLSVFSLVALSAIGVDIKPLLAGAGIVGVAIGFGSQTLVKDVVAGIFYLIDDAFRVGDYVESGNIKGTVERISIRSLRLRHPRGMVHTVPFGHLGSVTNFSRDYIVEKLSFSVPYDADLKKVKKIIKKISSDIEGDAELGPKLLDPIKSQGVRELADSGMVMRIKFRTRPFDQFVIRREIFGRLQKAFEKGGIQFATRQVIVHLPGEPGSESTVPHDSGESPSASPTGRQALSAGAAATIAQVLAEEEDAKAKKASDTVEKDAEE